MPTYAYRCESCGHEFEEFQSIKADPIKVCPKCKRSKVRRLIGTGAALLFKGSGFYKTDYRSSSYSKDAKSDSASASGSNATSSSTDGSTSSSVGSNDSSDGSKGSSDSTK